MGLGYREAILFTSNYGGVSYDIWLYQPLTGHIFKLTQDLAEEFSIPYWSPDTQYISFIGKNNIVYVFNLSNRALAQIDQIEPYTLLSWSPDSLYLSYVRNGRIVIYNINTHASSTIVEEGATDVQWFPSGEALLFVAPDGAGNVQLYKISRDGTNKQQLTQNTEGPLHNVRIAPNGQFALYTSPGASISLITTVNLTTGESYRLEGGPQAKNYFPEWSPDSSHIAYSATDIVQNQYVSLIQTGSRVGGQQKTLAVSTCFSTPVSWSPDGNRIAYLSGCENQEPADQIWIVDVRNPNNPIKVVEARWITALNWSPPIHDAHPKRLYLNHEYKVSFFYPANWRKVTEERYEGIDGFFQISAISSERGIHEVCRSEAFHILKPYGSNPQIVPTLLQSQAACFIFPSEDQPTEMRNQAALIVKYPYPIVIQGNSYQYFILWADRNHLIPLGQTLSYI
ncbi:hypothetical protein MNQ98_16880 [Paenibacillus sp. N3/727]|uniref:hypothetical protein n=1 Tax=Paenibacillus sp. N3/727 TaxID=2925845 RepID=UPI001F534D27|nr:hypothetical protein [Paenibacillus sp. N3/727]UNK16200.1 hypothetical protein MNQ98_16880 [Paenibacillus sp. N3/727]